MMIPRSKTLAIASGVITITTVTIAIAYYYYKKSVKEEPLVKQDKKK